MQHAGQSRRVEAIQENSRCGGSRLLFKESQEVVEPRGDDVGRIHPLGALRCSGLLDRDSRRRGNRGRERSTNAARRCKGPAASRNESSAGCVFYADDFLRGVLGEKYDIPSLPCHSPRRKLCNPARWRRGVGCHCPCGKPQRHPRCLLGFAEGPGRPWKAVLLGSAGVSVCLSVCRSVCLSSASSPLCARVAGAG